ncbi:uncharacterized protein LOC133795438 [Humulus lupulus]|uniref:uncharacterized protein LOC133795438 n=1 Tax=Humulus lupulus TaxID=3486 RepID=UPI002B4176C9|nr:uncharacterized protein LOC133795438 [Humulus lupulus]
MAEMMKSMREEIRMLRYQQGPSGNPQHTSSKTESRFDNLLQRYFPSQPKAGISSKSPPPWSMPQQQQHLHPPQQNSPNMYGGTSQQFQYMYGCSSQSPLELQQDKRGGRPYPSGLISGFQNAVRYGDLVDLDLLGYPFTWERGRGSTNFIEIRLDRALVTNSWLNLFPHATLTNVEVTTSDHYPIFLSPLPVRSVHHNRPSRFENAWLRESMCRKMVEDIWLSHYGSSFSTKLTICARELSIWGKEIAGAFQQRLTECQRRIKLLKSCTDADSIRLFNEENNKLFEILTQNEVFWRQRSKMLWLKEGDNNSRFFHAATRSRKRNNQIEKLRNSAGDFVDWDHGLQDVMVDYFQDLFRSSATSWEYTVQCINRSISLDQREVMIQPIEDEEVKKALFQMHPDKSPGPDGMTPDFYQKYWDVVGDDVVQLVHDFWDREAFEEGLTFTNIVLIPKKKQPLSMGDLRPISLCNVLYKVISKVLANRLKGVIDSVISET